MFNSIYNHLPWNIRVTGQGHAADIRSLPVGFKLVQAAMCPELKMSSIQLELNGNRYSGKLTSTVNPDSQKTVKLFFESLGLEAKFNAEKSEVLTAYNPECNKWPELHPAMAPRVAEFFVAIEPIVRKALASNEAPDFTYGFANLKMRIGLRYCSPMVTGNLKWRVKDAKAQFSFALLEKPRPHWQPPDGINIIQGADKKELLNRRRLKHQTIDWLAAQKELSIPDLQIIRSKIDNTWPKLLKECLHALMCQCWEKVDDAKRVIEMLVKAGVSPVDTALEGIAAQLLVDTVWLKKLGSLATIHGPKDKALWTNLVLLRIGHRALRALNQLQASQGVKVNERVLREVYPPPKVGYEYCIIGRHGTSEDQVRLQIPAWFAFEDSTTPLSCKDRTLEEKFREADQAIGSLGFVKGVWSVSKPFLYRNGRTLIFEHREGKILTIKFLKKEEDPDTLKREAAYNKYVGPELESQAPKYRALVEFSSVPGEYLEELYQQGVSSSGPYKALVCVAQEDYFTYMHSVSDFEQAQSTAIRDLARILKLNRYLQIGGLYHNKYQNRVYTTGIAQIRRKPGKTMPGRLDQAGRRLQYPNIGNGLRDLGDIEDVACLKAAVKDIRMVAKKEPVPLSWLKMSVIGDYALQISILSVMQYQKQGPADWTSEKAYKEIGQRELMKWTLMACEYLNIDNPSRVKRYLAKHFDWDKLGQELLFWLNSSKKGYPPYVEKRKLPRELYPQEWNVTLDAKQKKFISGKGWCSKFSTLTPEEQAQIQAWDTDLGCYNGNSPLLRGHLTTSTISFWIIQQPGRLIAASRVEEN